MLPLLSKSFPGIKDAGRRNSRFMIPGVQEQAPAPAFF